MKKLLATLLVTPIAISSCTTLSGSKHYDDLKGKLYEIENRMAKGLASSYLNKDVLGRDISTTQSAINSCKIEVTIDSSLQETTAGKKYIITENKDRSHIDHPGADKEYIIDYSKESGKQLYSKDKLNTAATWQAVSAGTEYTNIVNSVNARFSCGMLSNTLQHAQVAFLNEMKQSIGFLGASEDNDPNNNEYLSVDLSYLSKLSVMFDKTSGQLTKFIVDGGTAALGTENVGPYEGRLVDINTSTPPTVALV